ncbi:hypothetical protein [Pelagibacterium sp.]|uniref:hypothetical protein n=1 Tax=Pelagibacterium sp. TaxID=1967288 RepID=UPI003A8CBB39
MQQLSDRSTPVADFGTVSDLLADNNARTGYAGSGARVIVSPGQYVTAQGSRYEVVASDAIEFDEETAGGVRLKHAITGATRLITNGEVVTISSSDAAVDENLAILSVNNFDDNSCGLRIRSYWEGETGDPFNNNDGILSEVYNSTLSDSNNRSWAFSAANAYHSIPVGVTDSGERVGVLGWATSVNSAGYVHEGTLEQQVGVWGRAGFQSPGSGADAVVNEAVGIRGQIVYDSVGATINNAIAGQFVTRVIEGSATTNTAVYASARDGGINYSFVGDGGIFLQKDTLNVAPTNSVHSGNSANTVEACRINTDGRIYAAKTGSDAKISLQTLSGSGSANLQVFLWGSTVTGAIQHTSTTTTYTTSSDYRLPWKEGHVEVERSGAFIDALRPYYFPIAGKAGFIAHEFAETSPASVLGEKDAVYEDGSPKYQNMQASSDDVIANLVAELQSLRKRVAELENAQA